jgi:hypothetical protein
MRRGGEVAFTLLIVVVAGWVVWQSAGWALRAIGLPIAPVFPTGWGPRSGLFPLVVGLPTFILALVQLAIDVRGSPRTSADGMGGEGALDLPAAVIRQRAMMTLGTIIGFAVAIWLLGFIVAIPLMMFLYMKLASRESWVLSVGLSVVTGAIFYYMFVWWLNVPIPPGLLLEPLLG